MKKSLASLFLFFLFQCTYAQDSIPVTFHQESDTLVKQRFIDRYENVFMTKVPTRHMFKVAAVASEVQGNGINFGYEYKILPSLSFEASLYTQFDRDKTALATELLHFNWKGVNLWANAKARWYYNMNRRIRQGLSANNFSGGYFAFSYEQSLQLTDSYSNKNVARLGLLYGFQSRFLNRGYIDYSVGLFQSKLGSNSYFFEDPAFFKAKNFVLGTQVNIGIAFGDWKKSANNPLCDVLVCDESIKDQFKIEVPYIAIGLKDQVAQAGLAYERRIGNTPLSIQGGTELYYTNRTAQNFFHNRYFNAGAALELRYYFLQNYMMRRGKTGSNFSGPYVGLRGAYDVHRGEITYVYQPELNRKFKYETTSGELHLGYQQRLFKRLYINGSIFYRKQAISGDQFIGATRPFLSSKMTIGLTL